MCSVTKWVHVHDGDNGVKYLFDMIYKMLERDGIFILEAQGMI